MNLATPARARGTTRQGDACSSDLPHRIPVTQTFTRATTFPGRLSAVPSVQGANQANIEHVVAATEDVELAEPVRRSVAGAADQFLSRDGGCSPRPRTADREPDGPDCRRGRPKAQSAQVRPLIAADPQGFEPRHATHHLRHGRAAGELSRHSRAGQSVPIRCGSSGW